MDEGVAKIKALALRVKTIHLADKSKVFNTARIEALEVENLIEVGLGHHGFGSGSAREPWRSHGRRL
jgi:succinate dehydrogenase/fumarate reductase flavoprotein subunit